jgi:RNA polymerase sigma-70 factor (ECF subfamily)
MPAELRLVTQREPPPDIPLDFEGFFARESATLFRRLWLVTRDRGEAEEIVQDAFIVVLERWERVQAMDDPTGYLYRVAFNAWRKRARRAAQALQRVVSRPTGPQDPFESADVSLSSVGSNWSRRRDPP